MIAIKETLFIAVLLAVSVVNVSERIRHRNNITTYIHSLSKSAIKVIKDVDNESFLTCISITTANSQESAWQHTDIINNIAGGVINGMSIISSNDANGTFDITSFKERKSFNILVVDGLNGFRVLANQIPVGNFNYEGKFLVIVNNVMIDYMTVVTEISQRFFYDYIVNINILIPNPLLNTQVFMFTYHPYKPLKCSRCNVELYNIFEDKTFLSNKTHFPNKLHNFYNCTIVVAAFNTTPYVNVVKDKNGKEKLVGFEGKLFSTVADILNLNIELIIPPLKWGVIYPNRTFTGAFGLLHHNKANVTLGSFFHRYKTFEMFDLTLSYHNSYLCIVIPSGRPFTSLEKTMWPFRKSVWYAILIILVFKVVIIQGPIKILSLNRHLDCIDFLDYVRIYLGLNITQYPTKFLSKIFVVGMFFYALILRSCYQSSLFQFMTLMINVSAIRSVNELIEENFRFHLIEPLMFVLETLPELKSRSVFVSEQFEHKLMEDERINWDRKIAVITTRNHDSGAMIPIAENIYQLSIAMVLRRNSYFTDRINGIIYKLFDNGYISKLNLSFKKENQIHGASDTGLLSLDDVVGLFRICFGGYLLALAVFGYEIASMIFQKWKTAESRKKMVYSTRQRLI
ncbi:uncharacterized protein LOC119068649 [Bradysia coprophila]|uniref:uncharacterized protein LOC119068649 n=1 Tax=Bradysia coprophila TaxID=38358 RepID=UPI00187DC6BC|nr:uncharacterized protein LOC119068649 [Bradysia coprophila]